MLTFLDLAARFGVIVESYDDRATGTLVESDDGPRLVSITLRPRVTYGAVPATPAAEDKLHEEAQALSILGNSVTAEITVLPENVFVIAAR